MAYKQKRNQQTVLEVLIIGIGRLILALIKLPFRTAGRRRGLSMSDKQYVIGQRHQIEDLVQSRNQSDLQRAVFEADKLVDYILQAKGYSGQNFADRLRNAERDIDRSLYNLIWQGHKVRNQLAHEHGVGLSEAEIRGAAEKLIRYIKNSL